MHIFIDGYNFIRQSAHFLRFERQSLENGRKALIEALAQYRLRKGHDITVVFDGWQNGPPLEERDYLNGIFLIYSGRGVKADDVLKRIIASSDEEIVVVSSDHEIASYARRKGKTALSSPEFEAILERRPQDRRDESAPEETGESSRTSSKKGPARKLSRARRRARIKVAKL